jgi:hypothetical protein
VRRKAGRSAKIDTPEANSLASTINEVLAFGADKTMLASGRIEISTQVDARFIPSAPINRKGYPLVGRRVPWSDAGKSNQERDRQEG